MGSFYKNGKLYTGKVEAELTGRNVEEIYAFNALAITTTNFNISPLLDLSKYKKIFMIAESTLNQPADIYPRTLNGNADKVWDGTQWVRTGYADSDPVTINNGDRYILNSFYESLVNEGLKSLQWIAVCSTAPTSGSLTIRVWGVPN